MIYIGEGIIPQVERYASKYIYNKMSTSVLDTAISTMVEKAKQPTGNKFVVVCNEKLWRDIQTSLGDWLARFKPVATYLWSKQVNNYVKVGATYDSYEMGGNTITFKVDRTFSREWGQDKGFGMVIDLTADKVSGEPAVAMFTLKGGDFVTNKFPQNRWGLAA